MKRLIVLLCLLTASCAGPTPAPVIITQKVLTPIPVPCVKTIPNPPTYPDTDDALRGVGLFDWVRLMKAGRVLRIAHEAELTATLEACK